MSTLSIVIPFIGLSFVNYEFPTLAAGIFGLAVTTMLTVFRIGLGPHQDKTTPSPAPAKDNVEKEDCKDMETGLGNAAKDVEIVPHTQVKLETEFKSEDGIGITFSGPSGDIPSRAASFQKEVVKEAVQAKAQNEEGDEPAKITATISKKSLKEKAVNPQVEVCNRALRKFHRGRHMAILPVSLWKAHRETHDEFETPRGKLTVDIHDGHVEHFEGLTFFDCVFRTMPLWLTVLLLILTRIEPIGLKSALRMKEPTLVDGDLGTLGHLSISAVGRFSLTQILGTNIVS